MLRWLAGRASAEEGGKEEKWPLRFSSREG